MKKIIISIVAILACIGAILFLTTLNKDNEYVSNEFGYSFIERDGKVYLSYGIKIDKLNKETKLKNLKVEVRGCSKKNKILYSITKNVGDITNDEVYFGGTEKVKEVTPKVEIVLYYSKEKNAKKVYSYTVENIEVKDNKITGTVNLEDSIKKGYATTIFYKDGKIVGGSKSKTQEYKSGESNVELEIPEGLDYDTYKVYFSKK